MSLATRAQASVGSAYITISPWSMYTVRRRWGLLAILFVVATSNYCDRHIIAVLLESIKREFHVSDTMLGLLSGVCFSLFYAVAGMPIARWADRGNRRTIITLALAVWSAMSMLCGLAQTFSQLALARVGVGAGEAGAIPSAQSLIADYFPPEQRATAIAIFTSAATAGYLLGFGVGGYVGATQGWRTAFLLVGAPGLALAVIVRMTLAEPRLQLGFDRAGESAESMREAVGSLRRKPAFLYALVACLLYFLYAYGVGMFIPSFMTRVLHASMTQISVTYGAVAALASVIGTLGGGWWGDRLARRDIRWLLWLPAISFFLAGPIFLLAYSVNSFRMFITLNFVAITLESAALPLVYTGIHAVCGSARRAMAIAIVFFSATLFGGGLGPLASGALSDKLGEFYGDSGLRFALMIMMTVLILSGVLLLLGARAMPGDLEA